MTDPIAEAAANLAKQHSEPSLIEEIKEGMHDLAEKVEHLIHPETLPNVAHVASEAMSGATVSDTVLASEGSEAPNVLPASTSGTLPESTPSAGISITTGSVNLSGTESGNVLPTSDTTVSMMPASVLSANSSESAELGNVAAVGTASSLAESSAQSALTLPETLTASSGSGDLPNVATGAVGITGANSPSAPVVSTSVTVAGEIHTRIASIKHHLSIRGFEQSAVADIHAELDAIERLI